MIFSSAMMIAVQFIPSARNKQQAAFATLKTMMTSTPAPQLATEPSQIEGSHEFRHPGPVNVIRSVAADKDAPKTVVINGKTYQRSPDNIYEIDGQRVLYKPRTVTTPKAQEEKASQAPSEDTSGFMSPGEMMQTMRKAQENLKARNQALDEISKGY